jgi:type IV pilus assembly protein PilC
MDICRKTIGNLYIEGQFDEVVRKIKSGSTLTNAIALVEGFDEKLIDEIYIGEESGRLDFLLTALAESFDAEAEEATSRLTALIEPILICVIGVCVGFIAISVITPLMSIYETAGDASSYL